MGKKNIPVHRPKTQSDFNKLNRELNKRGLFAIDALRPGIVKSLSLGEQDPSGASVKDTATAMNKGTWSNGPLAKVAWSFDERNNTVEPVKDKDGKQMGLGYVKWGPGNATPSVIPPLAQSLPYTASPLRYLADLTAGLGPKLMYAFEDGTYCEYKKAGYRILERIEKLKKGEGEQGEGEQGDEYVGDLMKSPENGAIVPIKEVNENDRPDPIMRGLGIDYWKEAYKQWERTWYGYQETDSLGIDRHIAGAKEFLENNNLNLHLSRCEQDDVMLDIYFPTVGFDTKGIRGEWKPRISKVDMLPCHSVRLERMDANRFIHHVYLSDQWRTLGIGAKVTQDAESMKIAMYPAAMPQNLLSELRYIVSSNQKTAGSKRPMWVVCPTFYPSGQKPYYPQPAWWSVFSSKAFDFASTILYDKYKQRENNTTWGRIIYISLDYLEMVFADEGITGDKEKQQQFIDQLDQNVDSFLQRRENTGKTMRQFMWQGPDGKEHHNVEVVDIKETTNDAVKAGKEELELSTSPIFLALGVDPRLVGVPMVQASNGGTALREMHLLKQQQLNVKQRLYLYFLNSIARFNEYDEHAEFHIVQQTLTTLDNSKTGTVETIAGEGA